jgi:hypothetical protein
MAEIGERFAKEHADALVVFYQQHVGHAAKRNYLVERSSPTGLPRSRPPIPSRTVRVEHSRLTRAPEFPARHLSCFYLGGNLGRATMFLKAIADKVYPASVETERNGSA